MTLNELSRSLSAALDALTLDDLLTAVDRLGLTHGRPPVPNVLRYQVWTAVDGVRDDPAALLEVANVLLGVILGWTGAPILTLEDLH